MKINRRFYTTFLAERKTLFSIHSEDLKMSAEKFCLKWNDFEKNISGSFRELKDDEDFFDVTLTCDSDKEVSAHKVILSACSSFFRQRLFYSRLRCF